MKTRWKISLAVLVFLGLSLGVPLLTMHRGAENELAAYKKLLLAQGVKLKISEVMPVPVPADQNGADLVLAALKVLPSGYLRSSNVPSMMEMIAPGKAMVVWQQPDLRDIGEYGYTNTWENAGQAMEAVRPTVDLLRQAARFPALDFHLEYQKGPETPLQHPAPLLKSVRCLAGMTVYGLHAGDPAEAVTNLGLTLDLVRVWRDERTVFSQSMRLSMVDMAFQVTWELLQTTNVDDANLARLQKKWEQVELTGTLERTLLMDQAMIDETMVQMRESTQAYRRISGYSPRPAALTGDFLEDAERRAQDGWHTAQEQGAEVMWQAAWGWEVELRFLQDMQEIMGTMRFMNTNGYFQPAYSNMISRIEQTDEFKAGGFDDHMDQLLDAEFHSMSRLLSAERVTIVRRVMRTEASRRLVITAIALKRFQLRHGQFPEQLSELVPEFMAAMPRDAVDGQPLRYRRNQDGTYLLYSIGDDGVDNGGDPTAPASVRNFSGDWTGNDTHDWVWPQAATAAEVEKYYADEAAKGK